MRWQLNIPDGEIFTSPVKDSVNGIITYNTPRLSVDVLHERPLEFKNGQIIRFSADQEPGFCLNLQHR